MEWDSLQNQISISQSDCKRNLLHLTLLPYSWVLTQQINLNLLKLKHQDVDSDRTVLEPNVSVSLSYLQATCCPHQEDTGAFLIYHLSTLSLQRALCSAEFQQSSKVFIFLYFPRVHIYATQYRCPEQVKTREAIQRT